MLELGRQRAVAGDRGPAVGQHLHMRAAEIDHRLHREEHARLEHDAFTLPADMHDVGLVMEQPAETVAAKVAHHAHVLGFHVRLDGGADVAGGRARPDGGDAAHHRLMGHLDQPLGAAGDRPDGVHAAGIAVPAVQDQRHVDIDDVAFLHRLVGRNAVADHVIERGAGGFLVAAIHQRGRQRPVIHRIREHQLVDFFGRHARRDVLGQHVEASGHELAGLAHALEGGGAVDLDLAGLAQGGDGGVDVGHGANVRAGAAGEGASMSGTTHTPLVPAKAGTQHFLFVIPGRSPMGPRAARPDDKLRERTRNPETATECASGFRVRAFGASRNDEVPSSLRLILRSVALATRLEGCAGLLLRDARSDALLRSSQFTSEWTCVRFIYLLARAIVCSTTKLRLR